MSDPDMSLPLIGADWAQDRNPTSKADWVSPFLSPSLIGTDWDQQTQGKERGKKKKEMSPHRGWRIPGTYMIGPPPGTRGSREWSRE